MLQQNYQKPTSSQGVVSSRVLAVPNTQNFNCKHRNQNRFFSPQFQAYTLVPSTIFSSSFYYVFMVLLTTVPDSTVSNGMTTDNMEFSEKKSSLTQNKYHFGIYLGRKPQRIVVRKTGVRIRFELVTSSLNYCHFNYPTRLQ